MLGTRYVVAAVLGCPMQLDWTTSAHSYTPGQHIVVCADTLRIVHGRTIVETKGDGIYKSGFER